MSAQLNILETVESLTGFEEIAIEKHMGFDVYTHLETQPLKVLRALLFVQKTRDGVSAGNAKNEAMQISMKDLQALFDDTEDDPEEPFTPAGEDVAPAV